jgi:hypothetical protein
MEKHFFTCKKYYQKSIKIKKLCLKIDSSSKNVRKLLPLLAGLKFYQVYRYTDPRLAESPK